MVYVCLFVEPYIYITIAKSDNNNQIFALNDYNKHKCISIVFCWPGLCESDNIILIITLTVSTSSVVYCTPFELTISI